MRSLRGLTALGGAVFATIGVASLSAYRRDMTRHRRRVATGTAVASTRSGPVEYATRGTGSPVLVLHGAGGGWDQGLFVARSLPPGHMAIAPSRFGYLGTPIPAGDTSPAAEADAYADLLDTLGIATSIIVGVSAGAPPAVEFALKYPQRVRALVLMVPRGYAPGHTVEVKDTASNRALMKIMLSGADLAYWSALRLAPDRIIRFMGVRPEIVKRAPPDEQARVREAMDLVQPLSLRVAGILNEGRHMPGPRPVEQITAPTQIITAQDDLFETLPAARWLADRIAGSKLVALDSGGHFFVGRREEVDGAITTFLGELDSSRSGD